MSFFKKIRSAISDYLDQKEETGKHENEVNTHQMLYNWIEKNDLESLQDYFSRESGALSNMDERGTNLMEVAIFNGSLEILKLLVENGGHRSEALVEAADLGNVEKVKLILENNAYSDSIGMDKDAALEAIFSSVESDERNFELAEFFIEQGADINNRVVELDGDDGHWFATDKTLLHIAAESGDLEVVEFLLKAGANVHITDCNGKTPFDVTESFDEEILDILRQYGGDSLAEVNLLLEKIVQCRKVYGVTSEDTVERSSALEIKDHLKKLEKLLSSVSDASLLEPVIHDFASHQSYRKDGTTWSSQITGTITYSDEDTKHKGIAVIIHDCFKRFDKDWEQTLSNMLIKSAAIVADRDPDSFDARENYKIFETVLNLMLIDGRKKFTDEINSLIQNYSRQDDDDDRFRFFLIKEAITKGNRYTDGWRDEFLEESN